MFRMLAPAFHAVAAFAMLLSLAEVSWAGNKPMPKEDALQSAKRLIIETFSKELSAPDKVPAVKSMLETAAGTSGDDPAQAALYLSAAEVAARAGETKLAFEAIDQLGAAFDCDALSIKSTVLDAAAKYAKTNDARISVANRGLELAEAASTAGRFDVADAALKTAAASAAKIRDADLRKDIAAKRKDIDKAKRQREQELAAIEAAKKTLKDQPDDPEANEAYGKHLCFDKNDWAAGLKHLVKAADADLQRAATADLAGASNPPQSATLGDFWWSLGDLAESPRDRAGYNSRAVFWYTRALNDLTGFAKARVEKRLKDAGDRALSAAASQTGGDNGKFIDITLAPGILMRLIKIPASPDGKIKSFYLGQTEVTQKQWQAVMGSNPSARKGEDLPVGMISFPECQQFCDAIGKTSAGSRLTFRLPTPSEMAFACFYGSSRESVTPSNASEVGWFSNNATNAVQRVAQKKGNSLGLYDLLGNMWERTNDESLLFGGSYADSSDCVSLQDIITTEGKKFPRNTNFGLRLAGDLK